MEKSVKMASSFPMLIIESQDTTAEDKESVENSDLYTCINEAIKDEIYSDVVHMHEKCGKSTTSSEKAFPEKPLSGKHKWAFLIIIALLVLVQIVCGASILVATLVKTNKEIAPFPQDVNTTSLVDEIEQIKNSVQQLSHSLNESLFPCASNNNNLSLLSVFNYIQRIEESVDTIAVSLSDLREEQMTINSTTAGLETWVQSLLYSELQNVYATIERHYQSTRQNYSIVRNRLLELSEDRMMDFEEEPSLSSCSALPPFSPSGYYGVTASDGSSVRVYCDMTRSCGGVTGGWTRVAYLDMTDSSQQCPSGLNLVLSNDSEANDSLIRTCRRAEGESGCSPVLYDTMNISYSQVCGRVLAYQNGTTNAFAFNRGGRVTWDTNINTAYVDGVSLTHGDPRQHIWSFAAALHEDDNPTYSDSGCPCINLNEQATPSPNFVGNDYFCDTGASGLFEQQVLYTDDPL